MKILNIKNAWNLVPDWWDEGIDQNVVCYLPNATKLCLASTGNLEWAKHPCDTSDIIKEFEGKDAKHIKGDKWLVDGVEYRGHIIDINHHMKNIKGWTEEAFVKRSGFHMEHWGSSLKAIIDEMVITVKRSGCDKKYVKYMKARKEVIDYALSTGCPNRNLKDFDGMTFFNSHIQIELDGIKEIFDEIYENHT